MKKMRTENPAGWIYQDPKGWRLVPDDQIDPKEAVILWFYSEANRVREVLILPMSVYEKHEVPGHYGSSGCVYRDWMNVAAEPFGGVSTYCPEGVFGNLSAAYGFEDRKAARQAILQFARLKGATWAQRMVMSVSEDKKEQEAA
jgi:hypothetical protein